jgi:hypothetical protein
MGYPTKVQLISRKKGSDQYYINFPTAIAEAMEFQKGETIEWIIENKANIIAHRPVVPPSPVNIKKKRHAAPEPVGGALEQVRTRCLLHPVMHAAAARTSPGPSGLSGTAYCLFAHHHVWQPVPGLER